MHPDRPRVFWGVNPLSDGPDIICEELIREIVENVYVASEKKQEYAKQLQEYLHKLDSEKSKDFLISDIEKEIKNLTIFKESNYRRKTATMVSALMSVFAAMATILISLITFVDADVFNVHSSTNEFEISIVIMSGCRVETLQGHNVMAG